MKQRAAKRKSRVTMAEVVAVCALVSEGSTLSAALLARSIPSSSWFDALRARAGVAELYARAREARGELLGDRIVAMAMTATARNAQAVRVKVDAMKWAAARLAPKRWGDRQAVEISGPSGGPIEHEQITRMSDDELQSAIDDELRRSGLAAQVDAASAGADRGATEAQV